MLSISFVSIVLFHLAAGYLISNKDGGRAVFCYYGSWATYRWGIATFNPEDIDPRLCTHIVYAFTGLKNGVISSLDDYNDYEENWGKGLMKSFTTIARKNNITSLVAIGGWNEGSTKYSQMASKAEGRERFADSVVKLVERRGFHGFDLDWEYPAKRGGNPSDKENYSLLLKVLSEKLHARGLLLTVAVSADAKTIAEGYDIPSVSRYADFITVMSFDYHTPTSDYRTGLNSPLGALPHETGYDRTLNVEFSINTWLRGGADPRKLLLGTPLYGRTYRLLDPNQHDLGAATAGPGDAGLYTGEIGFLAYFEICADKNWTAVWNASSNVLYAYKNYQWLSYDDTNTVAAKTRWAMENNLGGIMIWSLESEDFHGDCGAGPNPLLTAINRELGRQPST